MRNLNQYPITDTEIVRVLEELQEQLIAEMAIGDIRPTVLAEAIKRILANPQ